MIYRLTYLPRPDGMDRIETGPLQVGDDWPGMFIRGDQALHASYMLTKHFDECFKPGIDQGDFWSTFNMGYVRTFAGMLTECNMGHIEHKTLFGIVPLDTLRMAKQALEFVAKEVAETWPGQLGISELTTLDEHITIIAKALPPEKPSELG